MEQIEILVAKDGSVKIDAKNFTGTGCVNATKPFEQALGVVKLDEFKPEFCCEPEQNQAKEYG
jgi:hypothetical protein